MRIKALKPNPDSKDPVRAAGAMTAGGALIYVLAMRLLNADPEVALGLGMILGPIVTAEFGRLYAYAPATVARLQAAWGGPTVTVGGGRLGGTAEGGEPQ